MLNEEDYDDEEEDDIKIDEDLILIPKNYAYLLSWASLILKLTNKQNEEHTKLIETFLGYLNNNRDLFMKLLDAIFFWLDYLEFDG